MVGGTLIGTFCQGGACLSYIPTDSLTHSIPCSPSDRRDTVVFPVFPPRRSTPDISRFHPGFGWWTILQILSCRTDESISFSVPDRHTLWIRTEDDILVQSVPWYLCFLSRLETGFIRSGRVSTETVQRVLQTRCYCGTIDICVPVCTCPGSLSSI
jgi:hypothetical protein